ncbi:MAG: hypothetical protein Q8M16_13270 [Pirellulaceae bacterium]|nr:hypothetical protein [Pirellulaceae bacterium]
MSMRVFNGWATLSFGLVLWFLPSLAIGGVWQEESEAKAGVQEAVEGKEISKEAMKAAIAEMQEAMKDAAKVEIVEGDAVVVEGQAIMMNPFGFEPAKMKAAKRFQLAQLFQVEIELIERLCEPTPQQLAKLRVGTKGAVKKLTEQWWKKAGGRFGGMVRPAANDREDGAEGADEEAETDSADAESTEAESVEIKDADEIDNMMAQMVLADSMNNPFKATPPVQTAIWKNLVAGVLTAEQSKILTEYKAEQDKVSRGILIDSIVGAMTQELALTAEQQSKVREIIQPHIAETPLTSIPIFKLYVAYYYVSRTTNEDLATVLSPAQIQSFRIFLLPVREIGPMMEMGDGDE